MMMETNGTVSLDGNSLGGYVPELSCHIWVIGEFPSNSLVTPRYLHCGEVFHPILNWVMPLPRLLIWVIMGNIFIVLIILKTYPGAGLLCYQCT